MTWPAYVRAITDENHAAIGRRIGITGASVGRWFNGSQPDPATAAAFARAYGRPVLETFVAAGFLSSDEAGQRPSAPPNPARMSDDALLDEVRRRLKGANDAGNAEDQKTADDLVDRGLLTLAADDERHDPDSSGGGL